ncbi:MAG: hypothetical protein ACREVK_09145 [Gammaproteobacteria bacterium]
MSEGQKDDFKVGLLANMDRAKPPEALADPVAYRIRPPAQTSFRKARGQTRGLDETRNLERQRRGMNGADDGSQGEDLNIDNPDPWEALVDGAKLLNELASFRPYAVLPKHADKVLAFVCPPYLRLRLSGLYPDSWPYLPAETVREDYGYRSAFRVGQSRAAGEQYHRRRGVPGH